MYRSLSVTCGLVFLFALCLYTNVLELTYQSSMPSLRRLSQSRDYFTGENLKTIDGDVPEVSCPVGHYRPSGSTNLVRVSGQRQDGCAPCPRGRYGNEIGLQNSDCSGLCPTGTYGEREGLTSVDECQKCPIGTYGNQRGLKTKSCSGKCPAGYYSDQAGATSTAVCKKCPLNYPGWQCARTVE